MNRRKGELVMSGVSRLFLLGVVVAFVACSERDPLTALSRQTGLSIVDVSVPFERFADAPISLRKVADAVIQRVPGLYVMRYYDDTLQNTLHLFAIDESHSDYIRISSLPGGETTREKSRILGAVFDESTNTLILKTEGGSLRLAPADVTSVGA